MTLRGGSGPHICLFFLSDLGDKAPSISTSIMYLAVSGGESVAASTYVGCKCLNTCMDPSPLAFPNKVVKHHACLRMRWGW